MKRFLLISILFLNACSNLPHQIQNPPDRDIHLHQVLENNSKFNNQAVRWGGTVIDVQNQEDTTKMQIVYYPLSFFGRPMVNDSAKGRFISTSKMFLDPAIFTKGTEITISGTLQGTDEKLIGNKLVSLPVVAIDNHFIWPQNHYNSYNQNLRYEYRYRNHFQPYGFYRRRYSFYGCY